MAQSELKVLHPYLYKRVRLKGILFSIFGLSSLFSVYLDAIFQTQRNSAAGINVYISGGLFLAIGLLILVPLFTHPKGYKLSRKGLYGAFFYSLFWDFILLYLLVSQHISTIAVFILWSYLTYNLYLIARDPAWAGAELVRQFKDEELENGRQH